ncbi:RNA polymerase sigma-70 factor (ECF subfamily) [Pedobacter cryoconitis]|uniref:RNA polymerase sigma-70 factor (ECF subfamily) n=1 Tax=Pedobacter cryoconitis TaxID=188932 RepID=A0A7W9DIH9_9SPHI|nr:RNA polymerase sigma factor [Pedobacter cryoconitis]MBB5619120.1 RNA polymerase sigma-70 factor (ECF subfamily) [Pedobacter cryoconitis]
MTVLTKGIIQDFINGDEYAFTQVYQLYYKDIRAYCFQHTRAAEIADELTSDVFLRLWEARANLDPEREIKPYLFTITKNVTFSWLKRMLSDQKMKNVFRGRYLSAQEEASQHVAITAAMDLALLRKIMGRIPAKRRQTFELCKIDGFTYAEAANMLSVSKETIKEHMSLAKRDLNKLADAADYLYFFLPLLFSLDNLF